MLLTSVSDGTVHRTEKVQIPMVLIFFKNGLRRSVSSTLEHRTPLLRDRRSSFCYSPRMSSIVQDGELVLRKTAEPVAAELFGTPELNAILRDMEESLDAQPDGVALAAPQIGISLCIFIVRYDRIVPPQDTPLPADVGIYINPEFVKSSKRRVEMDEGCLSVRGIYGKTMRHDRATVKAYDADGKPFERGGGGILAQIFQHETDHLNGILFVDHATDMIEVKRDHA